MRADRPDASTTGQITRRLLDRFVPARLTDATPDQRRGARLCVAASLITSVALVFICSMQILGELWWTALIVGAGAVAFGMLPLLLRVSGSLALTAHVYAASLLAITLSITVLRGGHAPASIGAMSMVPLFAILLGGRRAGVVWILVTGSALTVLAYLAYRGMVIPTLLVPDDRPISPFRGALTLTIVAFGLGLTYEWLKDRALDEMASAQRGLTESETRYRLLAENASDAISEWDAAGRLVYFSPRARAQIGLSRSAAIDRERYLERVHPDDVAAFPGALEEAVRGDCGAQASFRVRGPDGDWRWLEVTIEPFRTAEGNPHLVAVARDVSDRHEVETLRRLTSELRETTLELQRANQELAEFTSIASHDLQEPTRRLVSFSQLLRDDLGADLPEAAAVDLEMIEDGARRMQELVRDLLALSRAGSAPMKPTRIPVKRCVERALEVLSLQIAESGATISQDPLPEVDADATLLTAIYQNLISNALKFVADNAPRIHLSAERSPEPEGAWILGVRDRGIGIAADQMDELFKPFRRLHTRDRYPGSGIGLAICRKAVDRHGGAVWVESPQDGGAHFRFRLAVDPTLDPAVPARVDDRR